MPRRAHVPKTAGGATGGSLAHERAATELDRQGSLLLGMRAVPTTARALQQAAHPCLDPHDEREDGGRLVERQPLGVHLEGDRISHRHPRVRETRELVLGGRAVLGTLARTWVAIAHQNVSSLLGHVRLPALREDVEHLLQVLGADGTVPQPDEGIEHLLLLPVARLLGVERMQQMTKLGE